MSKQYSVPALEKSIAILEFLADSDHGNTVTEIHSTLDIPKATVFMILHVMESHHLVAKSEDGRYSLGSKIYSLGMSYMTKMELKKTARPFMDELSGETGHTVHLGRLVDHRVLFIEKVEQPSFIKFNTFVGLRSDIHISALGKAMAAYMGEDELGAVMQAVGLGKYTPYTITDYEKFKAELDKVRRDGYAVEDEEGEIGVRCIGAAIFDIDGKVAGAVSITALKSMLTEEMYSAAGDRVGRTARAISKALGYTGVFNGE